MFSCCYAWAFSKFSVFYREKTLFGTNLPWWYAKLPAALETSVLLGGFKFGWTKRERRWKKAQRHKHPKWSHLSDYTGRIKDATTKEFCTGFCFSCFKCCLDPFTAVLTVERWKQNPFLICVLASNFLQALSASFTCCWIQITGGCVWPEAHSYGNVLICWSTICYNQAWICKFHPKYRNLWSQLAPSRTLIGSYSQFTRDQNRQNAKTNVYKCNILRVRYGTSSQDVLFNMCRATEKSMKCLRWKNPLHFLVTCIRLLLFLAGLFVTSLKSDGLPATFGEKVDYFAQRICFAKNGLLWRMPCFAVWKVQNTRELEKRDKAKKPHSLLTGYRTCTSHFCDFFFGAPTSTFSHAAKNW